VTARLLACAAACALLAARPVPAHGQARSAPYAQATTPIASTAVTLVPPDYIIGPEDVLDVRFWKDQDMSGEVVVRPDGHISLPLLNDVRAAGLTPEQLRVRVTEEARRWVEAPNATVIVKAINSRKVFITGQVEKSGPYPLTSTMTVLQLIALAGGLREYAEADRILIMRKEGSGTVALKFDYKQVAGGRNLAQNITLKPGDTVIVP
jgi:polysaccharide export outer membrane protein